MPAQASKTLCYLIAIASLASAACSDSKPRATEEPQKAPVLAVVSETALGQLAGGFGVEVGKHAPNAVLLSTEGNEVELASL